MNDARCRVRRRASLKFLLIACAAGLPGSAAAEGLPAEEPAASATADGAGPVEIADLSLEDLLSVDLSGGESGSIGYLLRGTGIVPYVHGQVVSELRWESPSPGPTQTQFELRDFHLYFGADVRETFIPEVFLEFEPAGLALGRPLTIRYAQVDVRLLEDHLKLRTGLFLVPFGIFNTRLFPRFISKLPERPFVSRLLHPLPWSEVGVQLFGRFEWDGGRSLGYAVYLTNGQQLETDPALIALRGRFRPSVEENNGDKAVGFRVGATLLEGIGLGLSRHTGAFGDAGERLSLLALDASVERGPLSAHAEAILAVEDVPGGEARARWGIWAHVG